MAVLYAVISAGIAVFASDLRTTYQSVFERRLAASDFADFTFEDCNPARGFGSNASLSLFQPQ